VSEQRYVCVATSSECDSLTRVRLSSLLRVGLWASAVVLLGSCGQTARAPIEDEATGGAGGGSGGRAAGSGGGTSTGGSASGGSAGEATSEWDELLNAAGAPGTFSEEIFVGSCRVEPEPGVISECSEWYYVEEDAPPGCGHLAAGPTQYIWTSDLCPRTGFLAACLFESTQRVHYWYAETTGSLSLAENCELKEGWFYEP